MDAVTVPLPDIVNVALNAAYAILNDNTISIIEYLGSRTSLDLTSISFDKDITQTKEFKEAMEDVKAGRVYKAENAEDMFQQILGYVPR